MRNLTGANRVLTPIVLASCEVHFALSVRKKLRDYWHLLCLLLIVLLGVIKRNVR